MKLTITWDGDEGHASRADAKRLMEEAANGSGWITVLDFLVDVRAEAERLYEEASAIKQAQYETTQ